MALQLTLKPNERIIINGAILCNSGRKSTLTFESHAEILRASEMLDSDAAATPLNAVYYLVQVALIQIAHREKLNKQIQIRLAELALTFSAYHVYHVFDAANHISQNNYYMALRSLRPLMQRESQILGSIPTSVQSARLKEGRNPNSGVDGDHSVIDARHIVSERTET